MPDQCIHQNTIPNTTPGFASLLFACLATLSMTTASALAQAQAPSPFAEVSGPVKAFPKAYGGGASATGGRGFPVQTVFNLNAGGPGSFDQALNNAAALGGGTIVFQVSGTIDLGGDLYTINDVDNITLVGHTAPAGGVTITTPLFFTSCENWIIRYLSFRSAFEDGQDVLNIRTSRLFMLDHLSTSYGDDETISFSGTYGEHLPEDATIQNSLLADSNTGVLIGDSNKPGLSRNLSFNRNFLINISHRHPNINAINGETINNVIYNWGARLKAPTGDDEPIRIQLNDIGNYYKTGAQSVFRGRRNRIYNYPGAPYVPDPSIFSSNNYLEGSGPVAMNSWENWNGTDANSAYFSDAEFPPIGVAVPQLSAMQAYEQHPIVGNSRRLDASGQVLNNRDTLDTHFINQLLNGTDYNYGANGYLQQSSYINFQNRISAQPDNTHDPTWDSDRDGMADQWENAYFGTLARDGSGDLDADGWTDLEEFLWLIDSESVPDIPVEGIAVFPSAMRLEAGSIGFFGVRFSPANASDQSVLYRSSNSDIATISDTGVVTSLRAGVTVISATAAGDGRYIDTALLTVTQPSSGEHTGQAANWWWWIYRQYLTSQYRLD